MPTSLYAAKKRRAAAVSDAASRAGRDIGRLPPVRDPLRRARARESLEAFCREYLSKRFYLAWSEAHRRAIDRIEQAVWHGGLFAYAMPRGSGKTTLAEAAVLWAPLFGYRLFPLLIGSDEGAALKLMTSIKTELTCNDRLLEDFPEVCFPTRALEGIACRANGQLYAGKRTFIGWKNDTIVLPTIPGSMASGATIGVAGLTGSGVRGRKHTRPDGTNIRPDFVVLDDPQTNRSARSPRQTTERVGIINGAALGVAGPDQRIAAVMPCTVIAHNDVADQFLDRQEHPEWQGERTKLLISPPANDALWEKYRQIHADGHRSGNGPKAANDFYRANREAMDQGALAAWSERHKDDELSAIQHAMNLRFKVGPIAFAAEYQNEPAEENKSQQYLSADEISRKTNGLPRGVVPMDHDHATAFIDVQGNVLYWTVCAWKNDYTGAIIDYGTYPEQHREHFTLREVKRTLQAAAKTNDEKAAWFAGLTALTDALCSRKFVREDKAELRITKLLIDANYGDSTDTVYAFCRQSAHAAIVTPSHGKSIKAGDRPIAQYTRKPGERYGWHWYMPAMKRARAVLHAIIDVNHFKTFLASALGMKSMEKGALGIFGRTGDRHPMLADHLTSEFPTVTSGRDRTLTEWGLLPNRENHYLDCLVGNAVAANMLGAKCEWAADAPKKRKTPLVLSEIQRTQEAKLHGR